MKIRALSIAGWVAGGLVAAYSLSYGMSPTPKSKPVPTASGLFATSSASPAKGAKTEFATFAAGCFWGVEQEFRKTPGVLATAVGYTGGHTLNPTYEEVCTDKTGHAESVKVEFDPKVVSYRELVEIFWTIHDPCTRNRQGPDVGSQYRSVIFYHSEAQKKQAMESKLALEKSGELTSPVVTEIVAATAFTPAEDYHQQYVEKGGRAGCHLRKPRPQKR